MLHVITNTQDTIAGFILQGLADKNENRIIEFPRGRRTPWQKIIRHIESLQKKTSKSHYLTQDFQKQIASIKKEDTVLFFDIDYHRDLKIIKKHTFRRTKKPAFSSGTPSSSTTRKAALRRRLSCSVICSPKRTPSTRKMPKPMDSG